MFKVKNLPWEGYEYFLEQHIAEKNITYRYLRAGSPAGLSIFQFMRGRVVPSTLKNKPKEIKA